MRYIELKDQQSEVRNAFPIKFAFSNSQFEEVVAELGPKETLVSIGAGGYLRKTDVEAFRKMIRDLDNEMKKAMKDDDFLLDAIVYEFGNHEYGITMDQSDAISALGLNVSDERIIKMLAKAHEVAMADYYAHN